MKILNLYAGIGGNRKLWEGHEVTAVEYEPYIAEAYNQLFPQDEVVIGDAHQYLLDHFKEFDFIWSSPPCPTHSKLNLALNPQGYVRYPEMSLYQEIIFLKHFYKGKWVVENVEPYYKPLVHPTTLIDRHPFWANFYIPMIKHHRTFSVARAESDELAEGLGIDVSFMPRKDRRKVLRNAVDPKIGLHILKAAEKEYIQEPFFERITV
jgi:DNA (cytosine-5)-methyltransferase 1